MGSRPEIDAHLQCLLLESLRKRRMLFLCIIPCAARNKTVHGRSLALHRRLYEATSWHQLNANLNFSDAVGCALECNQWLWHTLLRLFLAHTRDVCLGCSNATCSLGKHLVVLQAFVSAAIREG